LKIVIDQSVNAQSLMLLQQRLFHSVLAVVFEELLVHEHVHLLLGTVERALDDLGIPQHRVIVDYREDLLEMFVGAPSIVPGFLSQVSR
jgi:hypothetical protein